MLLCTPQLHSGVFHTNTRTVSASCARYPKYTLRLHKSYWEIMDSSWGMQTRPPIELVQHCLSAVVLHAAFAASRPAYAGPHGAAGHTCQLTKEIQRVEILGFGGQQQLVLPCLQCSHLDSSRFHCFHREWMIALRSNNVVSPIKFSVREWFFTNYF